MSTIYDRLISAVVPRGMGAAPARVGTDDFRLRALPNEDVYLFVKSIDNSRVVRKADPQAGSAKCRLIAGSVAAALLVVALLLPSAYSMLAGRDLQRLSAEQSQLRREIKVLDATEAQLVNPRRIEELAARLHYEDPPADHVIYLQPSDRTLAMNSH